MARPCGIARRQTDAGGPAGRCCRAPLLARLLERAVVHDFRAADLALGGQGAPLVPRADAALLGGIDGWRALLNLGGIANLTLIPPRCGPDRNAAVRGWDCGPANTLIDLAMQRFSEGRIRFDRDGATAAAGECRDDWIRRWLTEPYFQEDPPKSTGRERFGAEDLQRRLGDLWAGCDRRMRSPPSPASVQPWWGRISTACRSGRGSGLSS